ncbi:hypothetical protein CCACVL1_23121 [Corchorus capsularis]|uniref:Uncharacterized protein n=1 Tax=Corchorus capsularis TaxID=210143 RepID=A0A1R3GV04_COCAP|nr:hypothetical protein CCACVL1_23121 [Corchorus capsularis]
MINWLGLLLVVDIIRKHKVKIIKHRHQSDRAQENKHGPENPKQKRKGSVEEPIADSVQKETLFQQLGDVVRSDNAGGVRRGVDKDVDLVNEPDGQRVAEKGEEENAKDGDIFE